MSRLTSGINLGRSLAALKAALADERSFRRLGMPFGWYLRTHYEGRLNDRLGRMHPSQRIVLQVRGRAISLTLSDAYVGALKGVFIDNEYDCSRNLHVAPKNILDLGANIGFASIYLSVLFPTAHFVLVEPDPRNLMRLRDNLRNNGLGNEIVIDAAVGPTESRLNLQFGADPTCSTLEGTQMHRNQETVEVDVLSIPAILARAAWSEIDLLKIDIEGAEEMLLASNSDWLECVHAILIEIHPNTTLDRISSYIRRHGFVLERLGNGREPVYFSSRQQSGR